MDARSHRFVGVQPKMGRIVRGCIYYGVYLLVFFVGDMICLRWLAERMGPVAGLLLGPVVLVERGNLAGSGAFWGVTALLAACWLLSCLDKARSGLWLGVIFGVWVLCGCVLFVVYAT
jgi:hypothetical protein